jgi:TIR domain-containing protein
MKFLRDYTHDIFVSYAHGPEAQGRYSGERHNLLSEWTHRFVDDLSAQIDFNLSQVAFPGREKPRAAFFMDPDLKNSGSLTENVKTEAMNSALLLVVMSPLYLQSKWCTDEIEWFLAAKTDENPELNRFGRIFVARIFPTDHKAWPRGLKDEIGKSIWGHFLHRKNGQDEGSFPYGWPLPDKTVKEYWSEIVRLAGEMTGKLRRLKELENISAEKAEIAVVEPAVGRQVFLGYMHDTLVPLRIELRRELTSLGLQILPPENDEAWDEASLRERLDTYLDQAHVMALCANQFCGTWPRDQNGGFISLQVQKAKERKIACQLWLSWDGITEPQTPQYKEFLQALVAQSRSPSLGIRIDYQNAQEFAQYVKETINQEKVVRGGVEQAAVICSNLHPNEDIYRRFHDTVTSAISETDRGALLLSFDGSSGHIRLKELEKHINKADTIIIICFDQEWQWATSVMREIRQLIKSDSAKRVRLLLIGPQAKEGISFDSRAFRFRTLNAYAMDEDHLREMLKEAILGTRSIQDETIATVN